MHVLGPSGLVVSHRPHRLSQANACSLGSTKRVCVCPPSLPPTHLTGQSRRPVQAVLSHWPSCGLLAGVERHPLRHRQRARGHGEREVAGLQRQGAGVNAGEARGRDHQEARAAPAVDQPRRERKGGVAVRQQQVSSGALTGMGWGAARGSGRLGREADPACSATTMGGWLADQLPLTVRRAAVARAGRRALRRRPGRWSAPTRRASRGVRRP